MHVPVSLCRSRVLIENGRPLQADIEKLLRHYADGERRERWQPIYRQMLEEARSLISPAYEYDFVPVRCVGEAQVELTSGDVFHSGALAEATKGAEYLALAVYTIGPRIDEAISRLFQENSSAEAVVLDLLGSTLLADLGNRVFSALQREAKRIGARVGPACSPGDADWDLSEQHTLFRLLRPSIGVRLTESGVMVPLKSVSLAAGIGKYVSHDLRSGHQCEICALRDGCQYRREVGN